MEVSYEDESVHIDDLNLSVIEVDVNNDNELSSVTEKWIVKRPKTLLHLENTSLHAHRPMLQTLLHQRTVGKRCG